MARSQAAESCPLLLLQHLPIDPFEIKTQSQDNTVTTCSSLVSAAVVNRMVKNKVGNEKVCFISQGIESVIKETRAGAQGNNSLEAKTEAKTIEESCFLVCSQAQVQLHF